jgi:hypothetical protein
VLRVVRPWGFLNNIFRKTSCFSPVSLHHSHAETSSSRNLVIQLSVHKGVKQGDVSKSTQSNQRTLQQHQRLHCTVYTNTRDYTVYTNTRDYTVYINTRDYTLYTNTETTQYTPTPETTQYTPTPETTLYSIHQHQRLLYIHQL